VPIAGGFLLALGLVSLIAEQKEGHCHDGCCGSPVAQMSVGRFLTFLVLLLPASVTALSSNDSFGSNAIHNRGVVTNAANLVRQTKDPAKPAVPSPPSPQSAQSPKGPIEVQVTELLYAAQDITLRPDLEGKSIQVLGQLMPETANNANGRRFKIVRMFMVCCAADARPIAVTAEIDHMPEIPEMSWVKVTGKITFPLEGGTPFAVLKAESISPADPPSESMLF
jgi:uncharacterized repeat protein (TIGR03943 family)